MAGVDGEEAKLRPGTCFRCGAESGVLFCETCVPREEVIQNVLIDMGKDRIRTNAQHRTDPAKRPVREVVETHKYCRDRQRVELVTRYTDHVEMVYIEVWQELGTWDIMHVHEGALDDQSHHGPATRAQQAAHQPGQS